MSRTAICFIVPYVGISIINAGALNANDRGKFPELTQDPYTAREMFTESLFVGLLPQSVIVVPFVIGFYHYGLSYESGPTKCTMNPEIWCGKRRAE